MHIDTNTTGKPRTILYSHRFISCSYSRVQEMAVPPPRPAPLMDNVGVDAGDEAADPGDRRLERRLHFYAAVYMMLGGSFLLRAAVPRDADSHVAIGFLLWTAAVALLLLSFHLRRFPVAAIAAARLAQAALRAFF